jgi:hypothetical protein
MPVTRGRLSLRLWRIFEASAEGPFTIAVLLVAFLAVLLARAMRWI